MRAFTVMRAEASLVPPGPLATSVYVVDPLGVTEREPEAGSMPSPAMVTSLELVVCHVRVDD